MGSAIWLFGWLVHRQTTQRNGEGIVMRGSEITYAEIAHDTNESERTLRKWMYVLRRRGYISVKHSTYRRMVVRVLNAKKFSEKQLDLLVQEPVENPVEKPVENRHGNPLTRSHGAVLRSHGAGSTKELNNEQKKKDALHRASLGPAVENGHSAYDCPEQQETLAALRRMVGQLADQKAMPA